MRAIVGTSGVRPVGWVLGTEHSLVRSEATPVRAPPACRHHTAHQHSTATAQSTDNHKVWLNTTTFTTFAQSGSSQQHLALVLVTTAPVSPGEGGVTGSA